MISTTSIFKKDFYSILVKKTLGTLFMKITLNPILIKEITFLKKKKKSFWTILLKFNFWEILFKNQNFEQFLSNK